MTWNPTIGCTRMTAGCDHCYAFTLHDMRHEVYQRTGGVLSNGKPMPKQYALPFSAVQLLPERLEQPLRIKKPTRFFVNFMSDLFHSQVTEEYIRCVFEVMRLAGWHIFQILTKRAGRLRRLGPHLDWPTNVWMGVSIENDALTPRTDALREVPAVVRFLSLEPLLGPLPPLGLDGLHWVIVGVRAARMLARCRNPGQLICGIAALSLASLTSSNNGEGERRRPAGDCFRVASGMRCHSLLEGRWSMLREASTYALKRLSNKERAACGLRVLTMRGWPHSVRPVISTCGCRVLDPPSNC